MMLILVKVKFFLTKVVDGYMGHIIKLVSMIQAGNIKLTKIIINLI